MDALTLCGFWTAIESGSLSIVKPRPRVDKGQPDRFYPLVMNGSPDIIGWRCGLQSYRAISIDNHTQIGLRAAAYSVGLGLRVPIGDPGSLELPLWKPELISETCLKWYQYICDWWTKNNCGQWGDSCGAAAWNTFRAKGVPSILKNHTNEAFVELESKSCHGGRIGAWFAGPIGRVEQWGECAEPPQYPIEIPAITEPLQRFDVKSMYPSILKDELFPTKLIYSSNRTNVSSLESIVQGGLCIAAVRIHSLRGELPRKYQHTVQYPVGTFDTVLSTPELRIALQLGEVKKVYFVLQYAPGNPFQSWAKWILDCRAVMKSSNNLAGESLCKSLANTLSGRLGAGLKSWKLTDKVRAPFPWGPFTRIVVGDDTVHKFRALGNQVQEWIDKDQKTGLLAACYSHLTSYGRIKMAATRQLIGRGGTVWQDTDGIMVRQSYSDRMALTGQLDSGVPGTFRTEDRIDCALIYGAKAYWVDGEWTIAGLRDSYRILDDGTAEQQFVKNPVRSACSPGKGQLLAVKLPIDLQKLKRLQRYNSSGWLLSPHTDMTDISQPDLNNIPPDFL